MLPQRTAFTAVPRGQAVWSGRSTRAPGGATRRRCRWQRISPHAVAVAPEPVTVADPWLQGALQHCGPPQGAADGGAPALRALRQAGLASLSAARVPTSRDESYRFTNLTPLTRARLVSPPVSGTSSLEAAAFPCAGAAQVVVVDGAPTPQSVAAAAAMLPPGVILAPLSSLTSAQAEPLLRGAVTPAETHPSAAFDALNAACCPDPLCLLVPAGVDCDAVALHVLHLCASSAAGGGGDGGGGVPCVQPRVFVHLGAGARATLVEEFAPTRDVAHAAGASSGGGAGGGAGGAGADVVATVCAVNAVLHAALETGASLTHGRVSVLNGAIAGVGLTTVSQAKDSTYALTSCSVAGSVTRHDVAITQLGPATHTAQRAFVLSASRGCSGETHTRLAMAHPDGTAQQLHKCIAAAPGAVCVFDGGVHLARAAQRTDAQQLSRSLVLAPRATVHAKPTLQICADDVKCSHGCSVADLSAEELFYFAARGIDAAAARDALVYSFGAEVVDTLPSAVADVSARLRAAVRRELVQALAHQQRT